MDSTIMILAKDYTIDIETLSLKKDGVVTSVAIFPCTHLGVAHNLMNAELYTLANAGVSICDNTLEFLSGCDNTLRNSAFAKAHELDTMAQFIALTASRSDPIHISELPDMKQGQAAHSETIPNLWANGKDFDNVLLEAAMYDAGLNPADYWHYRQWKDLPTLLWYRNVEKHKKAILKYLTSCPFLHHPVFDCMLEALYLELALGKRPFTGLLDEPYINHLLECFEAWATNRIKQNREAMRYA